VQRGCDEEASPPFRTEGRGGADEAGTSPGAVADGAGDVDAGAAGGEKEPGEGGGEPDRLRARSARGGVRFFPASWGALIG